MQSEAGQKCVGCCLFRKSTTFLSQNAGKKIRCTEVFAPHTAEDFALSDLLHNRDFVSQVAELDNIYAALGAFQVGDAFAAQVIDERFLAQGDKLGFREHGHDFVLHLPDADFAAFASPEAFVFFGGLTKAGDLIMEPIKKSYDEHVMPVFKGKAQFLISGLDGSSAAVLGASAIGWDIQE